MNINELYRSAVNGDRAARNEIFRVLSESFALIARQRIGRKEDCEDIVQDALTAVADRFGSADIRTNFGGWCHSVIHNKIVDFYRKGDRRAASTSLDSDREAVTAAHNEHPGFRSRLLSCFRKVLKQNPRRARVMNLYYQGYTVDEICSRLGVSRASVYILLSRARAGLLHCLDKEDE